MIKLKVSLLLIPILFSWNLYSQTTLSHNIGNNVIPNSMYSCSFGGICWARKFELSDFGITTNQNFTISSGEVGLFYGINWDTNLQFNIYSVDSNFPTSFSESSLIGSSQIVQIPLNTNINQIIHVDFVNPILVPAGTETILVEVFQLSSSNSEAHAFVAGTEFDNDYSWFRSKNFGCPPYNTYSTTVSLSRPDAKFYITVNGITTNVSPFNLSILNNCNDLSHVFNLTNDSDIISVLWNFGDVNSGANNNSTSVNPTHLFSSTGQYNVTATITNISNEIYNINHIVNVLNPPVANFVQPIHACLNINTTGEANFNTSNIESILLGNQTDMITTYFDIDGNQLQSPLPNPFTSTNTSIKARVTNSNNINCYDETTINFLTDILPVANFINDIYSCDNNSNGIATFDLSNITTTILGNQTNMVVQLYNENNQNILHFANNYTNTIPYQETITATITNPVTNCSSETTFDLITILTNSPISISPQQFCIQENATINNIQITGQNILWYDATTGGSLLPITTALQNGITYYASQTINGCESDRVPVTIVIQNTAAPAGNGNQSFCSTANATLNDIIVNGSNIIWYDSVSNGNVLPSATLLSNNTTYFATQTVNNCESPTRLAITISLINTLNATNYSESICDDLNNGTETVNLTNYNSNLIASANNSFSYYTSSNGAENQISSEEILNPTNYNLTLGNYIIYVRIDSPNTCHQVVELNLTLFSKPVLNINDVMPICEGSSITISAGNGFDNYLWSTNEITPSITIFQAGNYSVTVSENHGSLICSTTKNFSVVNSNIGTISEIITSDWNTNENTISVLLSTTSNGDYEYSLNGIDYQDSPIFTNLENGEYTVYVRDKNGCGINSEEVYLLMYPKYFTPNNDGHNDFWKIKFSENEPNLTVKIFDRYGKFIKEISSNSIGWDGTYLGKQSLSGDYWFVVTRENGKEFKGHFSLIR